MSTPAFRVGPWQPAELRKQAEAAASKSEFIDDMTNTAAFILGFEDGFKGNDPDAFIPGGYEKPYNAGHSEGVDARNHSDMLSNSIPRKHCLNCGAVIEDGECTGCGGKCDICGSTIDAEGFCPNDACPEGLAPKEEAGR